MAEQWFDGGGNDACEMRGVRMGHVEAWHEADSGAS